MNIEGAWKRGYTGKNIVVTILDDGIERTHPDLMQNYVSECCGQNALPPGKQWDSHEDDENGAKHGGFPGGSVVEIPPANAGEAGAIPGSARSPREGNGNWLQCSCLGSPMDRGACQSTVHLHTAHGVTKESDTTYLLNSSKRRKVTEKQLLCIAPISHKSHSQRAGIRRQCYPLLCAFDVVMTKSRWWGSRNPSCCWQCSSQHFTHAAR